MNVAVVLAHPDDAEISCFGTMLKLRLQGDTVSLVIVCAGDRGISVAEQQRGGAGAGAAARLIETQQAFDGTGIDIQMLGIPDGEAESFAELIPNMERSLLELKPEVIITHKGPVLVDDHQDHIAVGRAVINCCSRLPSVGRLLCVQPLVDRFSAFRPNYFVDITDHFDQKLSALHLHKSQSSKLYLSEAFHRARASHNALLANREQFANQRIFEAFELLLEIVK